MASQRRQWRPECTAGYRVGRDRSAPKASTRSCNRSSRALAAATPI